MEKECPGAVQSFFVTHLFVGAPRCGKKWTTRQSWPPQHLLLDRRTSPGEAERGMLALIRIETVLAVMVVLNLIGLTIAAYIILRRK